MMVNSTLLTKRTLQVRDASSPHFFPLHLTNLLPFSISPGLAQRIYILPGTKSGHPRTHFRIATHITVIAVRNYPIGLVACNLPWTNNPISIAD